MTAYVSRGDKVILYAGTLNIGELESFIAAIRGEGAEVLMTLTGARAPEGPPSIVAVFEAEPEHCEGCLCEPPTSFRRGMTLDGDVIIDEALSVMPTAPRATPYAGDCDRLDVHHAHTWYPDDRRVGSYCKGVQAI